MDEGLGEGGIEEILLNRRHKGVINYVIIYNVKKCSQIDDNFDNYAAGAIRRDAHHPMQRIHGFMQSH